jgi:glycosyltransferase involved in cell wall biosynthesis
MSPERSPGLFLHVAVGVLRALDGEGGAATAPLRGAGRAVADARMHLWSEARARLGRGGNKGARTPAAAARGAKFEISAGLSARFVAVGGGPLLDDVRRLASALGLDGGGGRRAGTGAGVGPAGVGRAAARGSRVAPAMSLPGALPHAAVQREIREMSVYVNPRFGETFGLGVVEAMAASVPVVACAMGAALELIEHLRTGVLVPCGETPADAVLQLVDAVVWLLGRPDVGAEIGRRAAESVRARFGAAAFVDAYGDVYRRAAEA